MVTDQQARKLMSLIQTEPTLALAAAKAGMHEDTARKYHRARALPSQLRAPHTWRTRSDPFEGVWPDIEAKLQAQPRLRAKTLFADLQRRFPGQFVDGQLRTLQRRVKTWRALSGPAKEVFFAQEHRPGALGASDFTHLSALGVTIQGQPFEHLLYHFVLTYSNWETGTICFSESFESLSFGLQNALWELGGVPAQHRTDRLSAAVHLLGDVAQFTQHYESLLRHYGLAGQKIQAGRANENGDVEQRHYRIQDALDQALLLRGSRDFASRAEYEVFLRRVFEQQNAARQEHLQQERSLLGPLPATRLEICQRLLVRVSPSSTIRVKNKLYSVPSRLIGEKVEVRLGIDAVEVWFAQRRIECLPRLQGKDKHRIAYRHVIDWLVRKPGAFENYRYRDELFPTSHFRMAYDALVAREPSKASAEYLRLLEMAAKESEAGVDAALRTLVAQEIPVCCAAVARLLQAQKPLPPRATVNVTPVDLSLYDRLLSSGEVSS